MLELENYKKINQSFRRELIFHMGCDSGFYSEFNNMVLAIIYCLLGGIKFTMYSADANFKYKEGWSDYFLPFCEEVDNKFHHKFNARAEDPWFDIHGLDRWRYIWWRLNNKRTYLTFDLFCKFRMVSFSRLNISTPIHGLEGGLREITRQIVNMIYRFNSQTAEEIEDLIKSLDLSPKYVGFHIRGGDKFVEHKLEQCAVYIQKAEQKTSLRDAFVLSDDYTIIEALRRDFPTWNFFTLTGSTERGYFHSDFQKMEGLDKKKDMIKLFAAIEILRKSEVFVGTFSSNPGMFLGMCMDNVYGVDYDDWLLW